VIAGTLQMLMGTSAAGQGPTVSVTFGRESRLRYQLHVATEPLNTCTQPPRHSQVMHHHHSPAQTSIHLDVFQQT